MFSESKTLSVIGTRSPHLFHTQSKAKHMGVQLGDKTNTLHLYNLMIH